VKENSAEASILSRFSGRFSVSQSLQGTPALSLSHDTIDK
jgi:hypothetical protein